MVIDIEIDRDVRACPLAILTWHEIVTDVVVVWAPGQASALGTASVDAGREVGQTAAFHAEIDGEPVELSAAETDGRFVDAVSGSSFDLRGRALDGPLEGQQLAPIVHDDTFRLVGLAFRPDTEVIG